MFSFISVNTSSKLLQARGQLRRLIFYYPYLQYNLRPDQIWHLALLNSLAANNKPKEINQ